jgi:hypothetical protein
LLKSSSPPTYLPNKEGVVKLKRATQVGFGILGLEKEKSGDEGEEDGGKCNSIIVR